MLRSSLLVVSLCFGLLTHGQHWTKKKSVKLSQEPIAYSIDTQQNIYLGFSNGDMIKYDSRGEEMQTYSLSNLSPITLIEAQNNLRTFLFYFDNQQISILDRFSTVPKNYPLSQLEVSLGMVAFPAPDGSFWVVENNPQRLIKIDPLRKSLIMEVQVDLGDSIKFARAFQNILLLSDELGLHVFDQFGAKLQSLDAKLSYFHLLDGSIVGLDARKQKIITLNPFSSKLISAIAAPNIKAKTVFQLKDQYLFVSENEMLFYRLVAD